jgi:hypothetical protein
MSNKTSMGLTARLIVLRFSHRRGGSVGLPENPKETFLYSEARKAGLTVRKNE